MRQPCYNFYTSLVFQLFVRCVIKVNEQLKVQLYVFFSMLIYITQDQRVNNSGVVHVSCGPILNIVYKCIYFLMCVTIGKLSKYKNCKLAVMTVRSVYVYFLKEHAISFAFLNKR